MAEFKAGDRVVKMSGTAAGKYGTVNSVGEHGTLNVTFDGERLPRFCDPDRCGKVAANADIRDMTSSERSKVRSIATPGLPFKFHSEGPAEIGIWNPPGMPGITIYYSISLPFGFGGHDWLVSASGGRTKSWERRGETKDLESALREAKIALKGAVNMINKWFSSVLKIPNSYTNARALNWNYRNSYQFFCVDPSMKAPCIYSGWDYREDAKDDAAELKEFGIPHKIVSRRFLEQNGIDPNDGASWKKNR